MPLPARRCQVVLSGFCGPCGQVSEEAAGAGVMVAVRVARFLKEAVGAGVMGFVRVAILGPRGYAICVCFIVRATYFFTQCGRVPVCGTSLLVPSPSQCTII